MLIIETSRAPKKKEEKPEFNTWITKRYDKQAEEDTAFFSEAYGFECPEIPEYRPLGEVGTFEEAREQELRNRLEEEKALEAENERKKRLVCYSDDGFDCMR